MELERVMEQRSFVVVGDTLNEEKYAPRLNGQCWNMDIRSSAWEKNCPLSMMSLARSTLLTCAFGRTGAWNFCEAAKKLLRALSSSRVPPVKNWFSIFRSTKSLISMDAFCLD